MIDFRPTYTSFQTIRKRLNVILDSFIKIDKSSSNLKTLSFAFLFFIASLLASNYQNLFFILKDNKGNFTRQYIFIKKANTPLCIQGSLYSSATYISFGQSLGKMRGKLMDVHGAGVQRSDPKTGPKSQFPQYRGPQGDLLRVYNHCRCVRMVKTGEVKE